MPISIVNRGSMREKSRWSVSRWALGTALVAAAVFTITVLSPPAGWGLGKYKTLYRFKGDDGLQPLSSLTFDVSGNLYGTTHYGGASGLGTVFQLSPKGDGSWTEKVLHAFNGSDGASPWGAVILDSYGNLYGTTGAGGSYNNGTIYQLTPGGDGSWTESVLYSFNSKDGLGPKAGLIFDRFGNLYGTTLFGGDSGFGNVFQLSPHADGTWTESVIHSFSGADGHYPSASLIVDQAGNLYSTTVYGGTFNYGTVFKLTQSNDGSWKETVLHSFEFDGKDGYYPETRLAFDSAGSLYGTTHDGGAYTAGTVFKLTMNVDGKWNERVLHSFSNGSGDGYGLYAGLVFDRTGNLYGATALGGAYGYGAIFRLKPTAKGGWKETLLHSFRDKPGAYPQGELLFDGNENLYGTTGGDLVNTLGSVFEVTP